MTQDQTAFTCPCGKFQWKRVAFSMQTAPSIFLNQMFILFFKYLDEFLVFWMGDLLNYSQTKEEHLKYVEFALAKFREASTKLKMSKHAFFKKEIKYLGHLMSEMNV